MGGCWMEPRVLRTLSRSSSVTGKTGACGNSCGSIPIAVIVALVTGIVFCAGAPDQYIYNISFHIKLLFLAIAGLNAGMFYLSSYRQVFTAQASLNAPLRAKVIAAISLSAWLTVIVAGRLITFYRPAPCSPDDVTWVLQCSPGKNLR